MQPDDTGGFVDPGYQPPPETRPPDPAEQPGPYPQYPAPRQFAYRPGQPACPPGPPAPYPPYPPVHPAPYPGYFGYLAAPTPEPPPRRRRWGLIVGLSLTAVVVISVVVSLVVNHYNSSGRTYDNGSPGHRLRLPDASGSYTRMTGPDADRLLEQARDQLLSSDPTLRDSFANAKIGIYSRPGVSGPALVFVGFAGAENWITQQQLNAEPSSLVLDEVFEGAGVTDSTDVDAGPLRGAMRCTDEVPGQPVMDLCAWADRSSLGLVMIGKAAAREPAASIALRFRGDAES